MNGWPQLACFSSAGQREHRTQSLSAAGLKCCDARPGLRWLSHSDGRVGKPEGLTRPTSPPNPWTRGLATGIARR